MLYSAFITAYCDEKFAKLWTDAHEFGDSRNLSTITNVEGNQMYITTKMDLHNNSIGIAIGVKTNKRNKIFRLVNDKLLDGSALKVINNQFVKTNGNLRFNTY